MAFDDLLASANISASGLAAERLRMEVIASNVANALSTRTSSGGPYRRQDVLFEAVMQDQLNMQGGKGPHAGAPLGGVRVVGVQDDPSELPRIHDPGHPDADDEGFVTMPNVFLPIEMVNLMTASRAYEANLKVLQAFRQQHEQSLSLLKY
jgi:flagellar basal-body rod protein FlgC